MTFALARIRSGAADLGLGLLPAAVAGYALGVRPGLAFPLAGAAAAAWLFVSPAAAAVALGASVPALQDLTGGRLGIHVAASDILLVVIGARVLADASLGRTRPLSHVVRPVRFAIGQYAAFVGVLLVIHPGLAPILKSTQRLELLVLPVLVGAFLALGRHYMLLLRGYVVSATVLAVAWPLNLTSLHTQLQKNPTGQLLANAILLLLGVRGLRRYLVCLPVLVVGLFLTASRGAIFALLVGTLVLVVVQNGRDVRVMLRRAFAIALTALVAFHWLPTGVRSHVTELHATTANSAGYSIYVRDQYQREAEQLISQHPVVGVGVGNYFTGGTGSPTTSNDPHDVILLQAAEGGYLFAASFVVLVLGAALALWRLRQIELAAAAAAVLIGTVAHGFVDVYWVRGTPVLSWLLVGVVCGLAWRKHVEAAE